MTTEKTADEIAYHANLISESLLKFLLTMPVESEMIQAALGKAWAKCCLELNISKDTFREMLEMLERYYVLEKSYVDI